MSHKFNPTKKEKLLSDKRYELLPPKDTLEKLMLTEGTKAADIGCGVGFFSLPAAEIVGDSGRVYALDISDEMLKVVEERSRKEGIENIETIQAENKELDEKVDYLLFSNVLHEIKDKEEFLTRYLDSLLPSGKTAVIEWKKQAGEVGPPIDHRIGSHKIKELLTKSGLSIVKEISLNSEQLGLIAQK